MDTFLTVLEAETISTQQRLHFWYHLQQRTLPFLRNFHWLSRNR